MKFLRFLFVLAVIAAALGYFYLYVPYGPPTETFVEIPPGTGSAVIAQKLEDAHVIRSRYAFALWRKWKGGTLRAGEYRFFYGASVATVYGRLAKGDVYTIALVIPEGFSIYDIASAVEDAKLGSAADFLAAEQHDTRLIADLSPNAHSLEGYLFPDTYRFDRHVSQHQMLAAMVARFRVQALKIGLIAPPNFIGDRVVFNVPRTVTLASLVEKEVHFDSERALVAGVFTNRLALNMPLATDPTVVYAAVLDNRWRGTIYQSDLQSDSPYNTYRHPGLPPGPIANPGLAALKAAMHPARTDFLYFVADAQGKTLFSKDLAEHAKQVAAYRAATRP